MVDIRGYEAMAMFDLPDDERGLISEAIGELSGSFAALEQIGTDGAEPLVSTLDLHNILREDVAQKLTTRDEILASAPEQYDGYFQVPGTLG